jgi:hypothetical protein
MERVPANDPNGRPIERTGPPPCATCPKQPPYDPAKGRQRPQLAIELTPENVRCWEHYLELRAVGFQGDDARDPLVMHHAKLLRSIYDAAERMNGLAVMGLLTRRGNGDS